MRRAAVAVIAAVGVSALGGIAVGAPIAIDRLDASGSASRSAAARADEERSRTPCGALRPGSTSPDARASCTDYEFAPGSSLAADPSGRAVPASTRAGDIDYARRRSRAPGASVGSTARIASRPTGALTGRRIAAISLERGLGRVARLAGADEGLCAGSGCELMALTERALYPLQRQPSDSSEATPLPPVFLGSWLTGSSDDASAAHRDDDVDAERSPFPGARILRWASAPEAIVPALIALVLGGLALGARLRSMR